MLKEVLIIVVLLTSLPVGWLLAYLTREELVAGRVYFKLIAIISTILIIIFLITNIKNKSEIILGLAYLILISLVSFKLSFDKKFVKR